MKPPAGDGKGLRQEATTRTLGLGHAPAASGALLKQQARFSAPWLTVRRPVHPLAEDQVHLVD